MNHVIHIPWYAWRVILKRYHALVSVHLNSTTVRRLLSAELYYPRFLRPNPSTPNLNEIQSDLYYPRFLRPNPSTPNLNEIQSDLYYPRFLRPNPSTPNLNEIQSDLYYPRTSFIRGFWGQIQVRPSTADNRGLTILMYLNCLRYTDYSKLSVKPVLYNWCTLCNVQSWLIC